VASLRRLGLRRDKRQLEVVDDPFHHREIREESHDLQHGAALGVGHIYDAWRPNYSHNP